MENSHTTRTNIQSCTHKKGIYERDVFPIFAAQAMFGTIFTTLGFYVGYYHGDFMLPILSTTGSGSIPDVSTRLAFAICCSLPMLLSLFAGIEWVSIKRSQTGAVDPFSGNEHHVSVHKNYTTNTLEQFVVGFTLMLIIASYADNF